MTILIYPPLRASSEGTHRNPVESSWVSWEFPGPMAATRRTNPRGSPRTARKPLIVRYRSAVAYRLSSFHRARDWSCSSTSSNLVNCDSRDLKFHHKSLVRCRKKMQFWNENNCFILEMYFFILFFYMIAKLWNGLN